MSFSLDIQNGLFFKQDTEYCLNRSIKNVKALCALSMKPYYDMTSNLKAMSHPFFHIAQFSINAIRFSYGALVFVSALTTGHMNAVIESGNGLFRLLCSSTLEILNTVLSVLSLATRFLASVINLGYASSHAELHFAALNRRTSDPQVIMKQGFNLLSKDAESKYNDLRQHRLASTLI